MTRDTGWFKSSYSGSSGNDCVEIRITGTVAIRDSKNPAAGTLRVPTTAWVAFLAGQGGAPMGLPPGRR
jgi:hypothetical protein